VLNQAGHGRAAVIIRRCRGNQDKVKGCRLFLNRVFVNPRLSRGGAQGLFCRFQGQGACTLVFTGYMPRAYAGMGPDPFVTGVDFFCQFIIGNPVFGDRPAGGPDFDSHTLAFHDKIQFYVMLILILSIDIKMSSSLRKKLKKNKIQTKNRGNTFFDKRTVRGLQGNAVKARQYQACLLLQNMVVF
jgi:hypothetical protein